MAALASPLQPGRLEGLWSLMCTALGPSPPQAPQNKHPPTCMSLPMRMADTQQAMP